MHIIEPFFQWRDYYIAAEDKLSPFYKRQYSEFEFSDKVYNYYIHPQWDSFGSETLYAKILYVNYKQGFAVIEMIGEWNDCIGNDIMLFKRKVIDRLIKNGIAKFMIIGENVLNFHASDDCYYEEWYEDTTELDGWIVLVHLRQHIYDEMQQAGITHYVYAGKRYNQLMWRQYKPMHLLQAVEQLLFEKLLH